jgi:hypothetical protein
MAAAVEDHIALKVQDIPPAPPFQNLQGMFIAVLHGKICLLSASIRVSCFEDSHWLNA